MLTIICTILLTINRQINIYFPQPYYILKGNNLFSHCIYLIYV
jgi:hypothetical protein